jgi:hypothetical protein
VLAGVGLVDLVLAVVLVVGRPGSVERRGGGTTGAGIGANRSGTVGGSTSVTWRSSATGQYWQVRNSNAHDPSTKNPSWWAAIPWEHPQANHVPNA